MIGLLAGRWHTCQFCMQPKQVTPKTIFILDSFKKVVNIAKYIIGNILETITTVNRVETVLKNACKSSRNCSEKAPQKSPFLK